MFDFITFRSTTKEYKGVFLIEQGEILALDDLLQSLFNELKKRRTAKIAEEARKEVKATSYRYQNTDPKEARKAVRQAIAKRYENQAPKGYVEFEINGSKERFSSFKEAITSGKLAGTSPRDFDALFTAAKESVGVTLTSGYVSNGIKLTVTPPDLCDGKALLDLEKWTEARRQPKHINWWAGHPFFISMLVFIFLFMVSGLFASFSEAERRIAFQKETLELLKTGINDSNRDKALELVLMNSAGLVRSSIQQKTNFNSILWTILLVSLGLIGLAWLHPRSVVGIGKGKGVLDREKWWIYIIVRVVFVSLLFGIPLAAGRKQLVEWFLSLIK